MKPLRWLATLFQRPLRRRESLEELEFHVEMLVTEKIDAGATEAEARRQARLELGDVEVVSEQLADGRAGAALETLARDLMLAGRSLRRSPFFAFIGVLLIALGVAATTTLFTLADRVLWRPLPVPEPEQLVRLYEHSAERGVERLGVARGNLLEWRRQAPSFQGMATSYTMGRTLTDGARSRVVEATQVTCDFLPLTRLQPLHGHIFTAEECVRATYNNAAAPNGTDPVTVLSHGLWQRDFGADPSIVGRTVSIDRRDFRIIGVAPPELEALTPGTELFLAWDLQGRLHRDQRYTTAVGRLLPGVSVATAASEELERRSPPASVKRHPETNRGWGIGVLSAARGVDGLLAFRASCCCWPPSGVLLLIASWQRRHPLPGPRHGALARARHAPGAGRDARTGAASRPGGSALILATCRRRSSAWACSYLAIAGVPRLWPDLPRVAELAPDPMVLFFALVATVIAALLAGLVPAWRMSRTDPLSAFGRGDRTTETRGVQSARNALVVGEVALTVVLLAAAGLLIRSVEELRSGEVGFDPRGVVVAPIFLDSAAYNSGTKTRGYYAELFERLRALPGVVAVGGATTLPTSGLGPDFDRPVWPDGQNRRRGAPCARPRCA